MQISSITLSVKDLDESIAFYESTMGCACLKRFTTGIGESAFLQSSDINITLFQSEKLPIGITSMACYVPDVEAALKEAQENGARVIMEPQRAGLGLIAKIWDPNDISIELIEMNSDGKMTDDRISHIPNKVK